MLFTMEYNTQREQLKFPDYGRNLLKLVEAVKGIEDRQKRTAAAEQVVTIMGQLNPKAKEAGNWRLRAWEHLMMMVDWQLDVDVPEGVHREATTQFVPQKVEYPTSDITFKHYGHFLEQMVGVAAEMPEGEDRNEMVRLVAQQMKRMYLMWNRDTVNDDLIRQQIERLSQGKLVLPDDFKFEETRKLLAEMRVEESQRMQQRNKSKKKKKK